MMQATQQPVSNVILAQRQAGWIRQISNNFYFLIYHEDHEGHEELISSCPS